MYNDEFDFAASEFNFGFNIGYRKQKPQDSKIFRAGVGYPELLYVGLGFSFKKYNFMRIKKIVILTHNEMDSALVDLNFFYFKLNNLTSAANL